MTVVEKTPIEGCFTLDFPRLEDERGWFQRGFSSTELEAAGVSFEMSQANVAFTRLAGTTRGMHYQRAPHGEQKLLRCVAGAVFDVVVDLREDSPTYLKWFGVELSEGNGLAILVPRGCAHGYMAVRNNSQVVYFADQNYEPSAEGVLAATNVHIAVAWPMPIAHQSAKDAAVDPTERPSPSGY